MNNLLLNELFSRKLKEGLKENQSHQSLVFFSAFIKKKALDWLSAEISSEAKVTIVSRWNKSDLASGASDLEVFDLCKEKNWDFKILKNLHSKLYLLNQKKIFLGSANLTSRGFNIASSGNIEIGIETEATSEDLELVQNLLDDAISLDQNLYDSIREEIDATDKGIFDHLDTEPMKWSQKINDSLDRKVDKLWVQDLFYSPALKKYIEVSVDDLSHDLSLLNLNQEQFEKQNYEKEEISRRFENSKMFRWFLNIMEEDPLDNKTFGFFSKRLHDSLLDEPPPYRSGVKEYLNFFEAWLSKYSTSITVIKSQYSSRYVLVKDYVPSINFAFNTFVKTDKKPRAEHNLKRQAWIGNGRSYEEIIHSDHPDNFYRHQKGSINEHIKYDLEKQTIKIITDSWLGGPESKNIAKGLDYSCFKEGSSGIPQRLYSFFNLEVGSILEKKLLLKNDSDQFEAILLPSGENRYKIKWERDLTEYLKKSVQDWEKIGPRSKSYENFLYFIRVTREDNPEVASFEIGIKSIH